MGEQHINLIDTFSPLLTLAYLSRSPSRGRKGHESVSQRGWNSPATTRSTIYIFKSLMKLKIAASRRLRAKKGVHKDSLLMKAVKKVDCFIFVG